MDLLKLIALDKEDLDVVSTHLQDALVNVRDIIWLPAEHRLVLGINRFDWEMAEALNPADRQFRRRRAALRFERVTGFKARAVRPSDKDAVLNLLAVEFIEGDPPSGVVTLTFSGGPALRLEVECLEVELADLGPTWTTATRPDHPEDMGASQG